MNSGNIRSRVQPALGFTLVELLIVIGIIAMLLAIAVPVISKARDSGRQVVCQNHLRTLWNAATQYAADYGNRLPGSYDQPVNMSSYPDWAGDSSVAFGTTPHPPETGVLYKYVRDESVYHCPSTDIGSAEINTTSNPAAVMNVNYYYDYVGIMIWSGVHLDRIPTTIRAYYNGVNTGSNFETIRTPIFCEVTGAKGSGLGIGYVMGRQHNGGCFYACLDGSVTWYFEPRDAPQNRSSVDYYASSPRYGYNPMPNPPGGPTPGWPLTKFAPWGTFESY